MLGKSCVPPKLHVRIPKRHHLLWPPMHPWLQRALSIAKTYDILFYVRLNSSVSREEIRAWTGVLVFLYLEERGFENEWRMGRSDSAVLQKTYRPRESDSAVRADAIYGVWLRVSFDFGISERGRKFGEIDGAGQFFKWDRAGWDLENSWFFFFFCWKGTSPEPLYVGLSPSPSVSCIPKF